MINGGGEARDNRTDRKCERRRGNRSVVLSEGEESPGTSPGRTGEVCEVWCMGRIDGSF